jgi:hypothetical protein
MIKNLTYKQLFYLYAAGLLLVMIIVFKIALRPTFEMRRLVKEKEAVLSTVSIAPQQIKEINRKLESLNRQFESFSSSDISIRDRILQDISNYCMQHDLVVYSYPEPHFFDNNTFIVESNRIILKGDFKNLLQLVNYIESKANSGRIVHLEFYAEQNRKTKQRELFLALLFQNIKNNE